MENKLGRGDQRKINFIFTSLNTGGEEEKPHSFLGWQVQARAQEEGGSQFPVGQTLHTSFKVTKAPYGELQELPKPPAQALPGREDPSAWASAQPWSSQSRAVGK